jgi:MFS family permease
MNETTRRLLCVRGLRAFGDGCISLLLPVYLITLGFTPLMVGVITTATLLGSAALVLLVGLYASRFAPRRLLVSAAWLMTGTGVAFGLVTDFWPLVVIAAVGTLNPSGGDVSVFLPLEQAALARAVDDRRRTWLFARYSLIGALAAAGGSLAAAVPQLIAHAVELKLALQAMFLLYAAFGLAAVAIYGGLPAWAAEGEIGHAPLRESRRIVFTLAALFSLDAFGGGFIVQSMLALWLFERFDLSLATAAAIFFWTGLLTAFSYLVAVRIASRIGLVNTMVFTHLPSSILLVLVPFMPTLEWAVALLIVRSALSQMDVPTRNSYVMAVVAPRERAAAASVTAVPRSLAASLSPLLTGYLLSVSTFGLALVIAGCVKITYDLLLLATFRAVRPPEEVESC